MKRLSSIVMAIMLVVGSCTIFAEAIDVNNEKESFLTTQEILDEYGLYYEEMEQDYLTFQSIRRDSIAQGHTIQTNNQNDEVVNEAVSKKIVEEDGIVLLVSLFSTAANSGSLDRNYTCTYGRIYQRIGFEDKVDSRGTTFTRLRSVQAKIVSLNTGYTWAKTSIDYGQVSSINASAAWSGTQSSTVLDNMTYVFEKNLWVQNVATQSSQLCLFGTYTFKKGTKSYSYDADLIYYAV